MHIKHVFLYTGKEKKKVVHANTYPGQGEPLCFNGGTNASQEMLGKGVERLNESAGTDFVN